MKIVYWYDESGSIEGFEYNGSKYYYKKNLMGDVIAILASSFNEVAKYYYDAWGKLLSIKDGSGNDVTNNTSHIGYINPIRYRGYYYDNETGLYYVSCRYYDPETCRFINADVFVSTGQGFVGSNMFSYCNNNAVNLSDDSGCRPYNDMMTDSGAAPPAIRALYELHEWASSMDIQLYHIESAAVESWARKYRPISKEYEYVTHLYKIEYGVVTYYYTTKTYKGAKGIGPVSDNCIAGTIILNLSGFQYPGQLIGQIHTHPEPPDGYHNDFPSYDNSIKEGDRLAMKLFKYKEMYIIPYKYCNSISSIIKYTVQSTWCK